MQFGFISKSKGDRESSSLWRRPFSYLRKKWGEVPIDNNRIHTSTLLAMSDIELIKWWKKESLRSIQGNNFTAHGWMHLLYRPLIHGLRLLDVGSGLGFDGLQFAAIAKHVTCIDIVSENIELLKRIADLIHIDNVDFYVIDSMKSFSRIPHGYDIILAHGSLHHAPEHVIRQEIRYLSKRLVVDGRWLQLAYPKSRWEREEKLPFSVWGNKTDGEGTPWAEWYDVDKLLALFSPLKFDVVVSFECYNNNFIWFDLVRRA